MRNRNIGIVGLLLAVAANAAIAEKIPSGTHVMARVSHTLSSASAHQGQTWTGSLTRDITEHGKVIARTGDPVTGKVTYVKPSGRLHAPGEISIRLTSVNGEPVSTNRVSRKGASHTKSNAAKIGGGAAGGAIIGGLVGGGKGAAIGSAAGAGAGTAGAAATGKREAVIPAESVYTFTVTGAR
ncbi:MAG TPA: hypothetical protein VE783_02580 [Candidatus Limnocylindrales bacterium]|nr:hypothetical protein [Candidatus Limnocylindrales bacterium]